MRIGVDITSISQMEHSLQVSETLAATVFTASERSVAARASAHRAAEFLAGRFAAKEAVVKALRLGIEDPQMMQEVEVRTADDGSPMLSLYGRVRQAALDCGLSEWQVSISHEAGSAMAVVLLS
jgi:holo-[acyl-carrier protein] synthase